MCDMDENTSVFKGVHTAAMFGVVFNSGTERSRVLLDAPRARNDLIPYVPTPDRHGAVGAEAVAQASLIPVFKPHACLFSPVKNGKQGRCFEALHASWGTKRMVQSTRQRRGILMR
jgi:hypothetical protein